MRTPILICILILWGTITFGQKSVGIQADRLLFEKALLLHQLATQGLDLDRTINAKDSVTARNKEYAQAIKETILEEALEYYQELIDSFPKSGLLFRALNNKGLIELELDDTKAAVQTFQEIIDSKVNDKEPGGTGSGIMAEPYANYKNRASKILTNIYLEQKDYNKALHYLELTKKYPYRHFCGNEYAAEEIYKCNLYARCYLGVGDTSQALKVLLPNILESGLADNSNLVQLTAEILLNKYTKEELKVLFERAFEPGNIKHEKAKKQTDFEKNYIVFLGVDIEILLELSSMNPDEIRQKLERICKTSQFFKLLSK